MAKKKVKEVQTAEGRIESIEEELDPKYLEGLTFKGAELKKVKTGDSEREKSIPFERPLTVEDILNWEDRGDVVHIVAADGRKYDVKKAGK